METRRGVGRRHGPGYRLSGQAIARWPSHGAGVRARLWGGVDRHELWDWFTFLGQYRRPCRTNHGIEIFAADANTAFAFAKPFVPGPIPKGVSTGALISFTPAKEASYTASATPVGVGPNNKPIAADSVQLTGKGVHRVSAAPLSVESAYFIDHQPLDFHKVVVGQHAYHTLSVRNNGNAVAVARVDWSQSPSAFTASMSSGGPAVQNISINANDVITLIITFSPTAVQVYTMP